ncbi:MAG: hypothetical protein ACR2KM_08740 [Gemmatimonadaceae bacterium]
MIRAKDGYVAAYCKYSNSVWQLAASEYSAVHEAWMAGKAFVQTVTLFGAPVTIRLADIAGVALLTWESIAAVDADEQEVKREEKARDLLNGGD